MKLHILLIALTLFVYSGISQGQQCPPGCQAKVDALQNQVIALQAAISRAPFLQKFVLTPTPRGASQSASAEQDLPNYLNALLVHVTVDHNMVAVLFPAAAPTTKSSEPLPNRASFTVSCRGTSGGTAQAKASASVLLGLLREDSGKALYGIKVTVEGCDAAGSQIPVEIAVLSKP